MKRHPKGGWRARALYRPYSGEVKEMSRFGRTRAAAEDALGEGLKDALKLVAGDSVVTERTTMGELAQLWVDSLDTLELAKDSKRVYATTAKNYIIAEDSTLRALPIGEATPAKLSASMREVGMEHGHGTAKTLHTVYRGIFELAIQHEALSVNPARNATLSVRSLKAELDREGKLRVKEGVDRAFTDRQRKKILKEVSANQRWVNLQLEPLIWVLAALGPRISEAISLNWEDINWKAGTVHLHGTKTVGSDRVVAAPRWLLKALKQRRVAQGKPKGSAPVCPSPTGKRRDASNSVRHVTEFLAECGMPWATSHTFRKTVATRLDKAGFTPREIADHLGHADPHMTLKVYMDRHTMNERTAEAL